LLIAIFGSVLIACSKELRVSADLLVRNSIKAHQMHLLNNAVVSFTFRDHTYSLQRDSTSYQYTRKKVLDTTIILDVLNSNHEFTRYVNDTAAKVPDSMVTKYSASVNSVLYFFQIPLVLLDPAVNAEYLGTTTILDKQYFRLKVSFSEANGGEDFEDEYRYWINTKTYEVDYLAYSYHTDEGGIRFRQAINKQRVQGILFQDYRNFKPELPNVPLDSLPPLFEREKLKLLSTIENEEIKVSRTNNYESLINPVMKK
jgi:hypothetical protein